MKKVLFFILCMLLLGAVQTNNCFVSYSWQPPTHAALKGDCESLQLALPSNAAEHMDYIVKWKLLDDTEWNTTRTKEQSILLRQLPCDTLVQVEVSASWIGQDTMKCPVMVTLKPQPTTGGCQSKT